MYDRKLKMVQAPFFSLLLMISNNTSDRELRKRFVRDNANVQRDNANVQRDNANVQLDNTYLG